GNGPVNIALAHQCASKVAVGRSIIGLKLEELLVCSDRSIEVLLVVQGNPQVMPGIAGLGVELNCFLVLVDRAIQVAFALQDMPTLDVGSGRRWKKPHRLVENG